MDKDTESSPASNCTQWDFPRGPEAKSPWSAGGVGLVAGLGAKILHATRHSKKKEIVLSGEPSCVIPS